MTTVKESFKKFFIEFAQENFAQVTSENALTIYTAGDKNGRKRILEEFLESYGQSARDDGISADDLYEALIERIDTELKKMEGNKI